MESAIFKVSCFLVIVKKYKQSKVKQAEYRKIIIDKIKSINLFLGKSYGGDIAYLITFALTVYVDEFINLKVGHAEGESWELVQREIFDVDTGGNYFYKALNHIVDNKYYPKIVYQIYYFILKDGFMGEMVNYNNNIARDYLIQLEAKCAQRLKLGLDNTDKTLLFNEQAALVNQKVTKKRWFYLLAKKRYIVVTVILLYIISCLIIYLL
ncbi:DotU family type IV/VI secretion system protein [Piscirickettsia salmonis]|uniref:DotU family type IV/VI secretion system protein n=1 Tax=Piscirickettsia salmonis TaxID=1238 RepID=UPI003752528D